MTIPGGTMQAICDAIADAYDEPSVTMAVKFLMDERFDNIVGPGHFPWRVFNLVQWAAMNGRDVELVQALGRSRPKHAGMRDIYQKYGMSMAAQVQKAGKPDPAVPDGETTGGLEKIVRDHLQFQEFEVWLARMTEVGGRVCLIMINGAAQGTGFLVGPDVVLTNYHVMEPVLTGVRKATEVECVFDFKKLIDKTTTQTLVRLHPTDWRVDCSPYSKPEFDLTPDVADPSADELDYALIKLAEPVGSRPWAQRPDETGATPGRIASRGWLHLPEAAAILQPKMGVIIAQHPAGWPLKLAIDTDAIDQAGGRWLNKAGNRIRYATNTLGGSSGSPVFDLNWRLIALHHYGDPAYNHPPKYNQGVPVHLIRARLKGAGKDGLLGGSPM